jgi:hypothetical protein
MSKGLSDIFNENPNVEEIEVVGYKDGGPWGLSEDGRKFRIGDDDLARMLFELPGSDTAAGHITAEGYQVRASCVVTQGVCVAAVHRRPQ